MKRVYIALITSGAILLSLLLPVVAFASGISPSGGGTYAAGNTFKVSVVASGATFDSFEGYISVSGPVSIISFYSGNAIWANQPGNNKTFDGALSNPTTSFTIATITLRGSYPGSGSVRVSGVRLVRNGTQIGSTGGTTYFNITRAPTPPGTVTVTSPTNPDQTQSYGVTSVTLKWSAPTNGATGYSTVFDQVASTTPPTTVSTKEKTATFDNLNLGTYYFHIRAENGDGWGPASAFTVNIARAVDGALKAPAITGVKKLSSFANDITAGTLTGLEIDGTATGLAGYTATLVFSPSNLPDAQTLTSPVDESGHWSVVFNQAIPVGFYKVTVVATKDKTTTPVSKPVNIELSVANGGTAKIITDSDLPQPDLTVKKWGVVFVDAAHYHKAIVVVIALVVGFAALCFGLYWLLPRMFSGLGRKKRSDAPPPPPKKDGHKFWQF